MATDKAETIDGKIDHVRYHKASPHNPGGVPFLIAVLEDGTAVVGEMARPRVGESYRFYGQFEWSKKYNCNQFKFAHHEVLIDQSEDGVAAYLARYVPGLGPVKARRLVERFGAETLAVLRADPAEALGVAGISQDAVDRIRKHFAEECKVDPVAFAKLTDLFRDYKVSRRTMMKILEHFGSSAIELLREKPYSILLSYHGIGWAKADGIAVDKLGYARDGVDRHAAAILEAVREIHVREGHTYAERKDVVAAAFKLLDAVPRREAWGHLLANNLLRMECPSICDSEEAAAIRADNGSAADAAGSLLPEFERDHSRCMLPKVARAEEEIARMLDLLSRSARPLRVEIDTEGLTDAQKQIRVVAEYGVVLVVGGPGTGKSYSVARVLAGLVAAGITSIRVVAPTGKAAKRTAELLAANLPGCEIPCTTIHRALGPLPSAEEEEGVPSGDAKAGKGRDGYAFRRNEDDPFEESVIICEETSMADVLLFASFLRAVAPGTRLIIVGDPNQLPSVGPGAVLRDMLAAQVPTVELTEILRSDSAGRVVFACHDIKDGRVPIASKQLDLPRDNWVHVEMPDPARARDLIADLYEWDADEPPSWLPVRPDLAWDFQVVTPENRKKPCSCDSLNRVLSLKLNPPAVAAPAPQGEDWEPVIRVGDKVVRVKNGTAKAFVGGAVSDAEVEVVNGDMGMIKEQYTDDDGKVFYIVKFVNPERTVALSAGDHHLSLAYAITCHKAQGSGFPVVIVPVTADFYKGIMTREWVYTAFSRTERVLITVGSMEAIRAAIGRKTVDLRRTRLVDLLLEAQAAPIGQAIAFEAPPWEDAPAEAATPGAAAPAVVVDADPELVSATTRYLSLVGGPERARLLLDFVASVYPANA